MADIHHLHGEDDVTTPGWLRVRVDTVSDTDGKQWVILNLLDHDAVLARLVARRDYGMPPTLKFETLEGLEVEHRTTDEFA